MVSAVSEGGADWYATGAVLQFLARHADIHYDRSAISLACRLSYAEASAACDRLVEWGLVDGRSATIGVRVFGLAQPAKRPESGPPGGDLVLIIDPDRETGGQAAACLEEAGWRVVAVPVIEKGAFILRWVAPLFTLVDSFAEGDRIDWAAFEPLGLAASRAPALLCTTRREVDDGLARQHRFAGVVWKPLDCRSLVEAGRRFADAALTGQ